MTVNPPSDNNAYRFPVSIKGVVFLDGKVALLKNDRGEWELPGGKLEPDEQPEECVAREIAEELAIEVDVGPLLDSWVYRIAPGVNVLIVTYACVAKEGARARCSSEHKELGLFGPQAVPGLTMPAGYKSSISKAVPGAFISGLQ